MIEAGTTLINKENLLRAYDELKRENIEYKNLESAAKKKMAAAISSDLISGIKCPHRGFQNVRVRTMLQHYFDECPIDSQMIMQNETQLTAEWDPNRPFADLVQRATVVHEFANDAGRPTTNNRVMDALYTVIFNTGVMYDERDKWEDRAVAARTYANFKTHFATAQRKLKGRQKKSTKQGGFYGANALVAGQLDQANDALVNLDTAAASHRDHLLLLNQTIHTQNETIAKLTQQYQLLSNKMDAIGRSNHQGTAAPQQPDRVPMLDKSNWLPN
jgi:uncharacterized coiled-coil protein SlyX